MANLYSGTHNFKGYKSISELSSLTLTANKKYVVQIQNMCYVREGTEGDGFLLTSAKPFEWDYDGSNDLYIGNFLSNDITFNISE